jgi:hypothetical protein
MRGRVGVIAYCVWSRGTDYSHSIRNVQGEEGSQLGEVAQDGPNEGGPTVSDSTSQVEFQKRSGYLVWEVVCYPLQHPRSSRSLSLSVAGTRVIGVVGKVDHCSKFVGSLL